MFNTPIVVYTRRMVADALIKAGYRNAAKRTAEAMDEAKRACQTDSRVMVQGGKKAFAEMERLKETHVELAHLLEDTLLSAQKAKTVR